MNSGTLSLTFAPLVGFLATTFGVEFRRTGMQARAIGPAKAEILGAAVWDWLLKNNYLWVLVGGVPGKTKSGFLLELPN